MNIRIVREAGGIGDIVRIIPVLRGLREKYPGARLWVFAPALYRPLLRGWYDEFRPTPHAGRRPRNAPLDEKRWPYLDAGMEFDASIDLYCPAFTHEQRQRGRVWLDRIDLFCRAAGVAPSAKTPTVHLHPEDVKAARAYVSQHGLKAKGKLIAMQPFSTDPARNWPVARWKRLAHALEWVGHTVIVFDGTRRRIAGFDQHRVVCKPLGFVAALIAQCDLLVGPDSGLGHLAGSVGTPAVGLFASQSGPLMYRHYPQHAWVYPPWDNRSHCHWPCFWNRPRECTRQALLASGKTCAMLATISVERVFDAVTAKLAGATPDMSPPAFPLVRRDAHAENSDVYEVTTLPIPLPDFSVDRLVVSRAVADSPLLQREIARVLRPGGEGMDEGEIIADGKALDEPLRGRHVHACIPLDNRRPRLL